MRAKDSDLYPHLDLLRYTVTTRYGATKEIGKFAGYDKQKIG